MFTAMVSEADKSKSTFATLMIAMWRLTNTFGIVYLIRTGMLGNGAASPDSLRACGLGLPEGLTIVDFKFLDEKSLLVLCSQRGMLRR